MDSERTMDSDYLDMSSIQNYVEMDNLEEREYMNLTTNTPYPEYQCSRANPYNYFNKPSELEIFMEIYKKDCKVIYLLLIFLVVSIISIIPVIIYLHLILSCK